MKGKIQRWVLFSFVAVLCALGFNSNAAEKASHEKGKRNKAEVREEKPKSEPRGHAKKIDLNLASREELLSLPGVGPAIADAIIAARPFEKAQDLKDVPGIGEARWGEIRRQITVKESKATRKKSAREERIERPEKKSESRSAPPPTDRRSSAGAAPTVSRGSDADATSMVNINTASKEELESLLGIGSVKAQAIIENRPFNSINEVMEVKGIKGGTFEKFRHRIKVR